ncbi:hypothetical protein [Synechocystis sp. CACIAM 05]|nr:hypothetical protein [Synechocystis sp. CACIAM 05]
MQTNPKRHFTRRSPEAKVGPKTALKIVHPGGGLAPFVQHVLYN